VKFTAKAATLAKELAIVAPLAGKRTTIPILTTVLIRADADGVLLATTDADSVLMARVSDGPFAVAKPGSLCVEAKRFSGIVGSFKSDAEVQFTLDDGNWLIVESGGSKVRIPGVAGSDFPALPVRPEAEAVKVQAGLIADLIGKALFAAGDYNNWSPIQFSVKDVRAVVAAMDGTRCCIASCEVPKSGDVSFHGDKERFGMLVKLCRESSEQASIIVADHRAWIITDQRTAVLKMDHREFPDAGRFFQKARELGSEPFSVARSAALESIRRAELSAPGLRDDKHDGSTLITLKLSGPEMKLSAASQGGQADDVFAVDYKGDDRAGSFSSVHLREFLAACGSERVLVRMGPNEKIGTMLMDESGTHEYIAMPRKG
jgi:DNA polymerase III subunit beta